MLNSHDPCYFLSIRSLDNVFPHVYKKFTTSTIVSRVRRWFKLCMTKEIKQSLHACQLLGMRSNIFLECTQDKHDTDYIIDRVFLKALCGFYKPDIDATWPCEYFWLLQSRGLMVEDVYISICHNLYNIT